MHVFVCVSEWVCACDCNFPKRPEKAVGSPGAGGRLLEAAPMDVDN